MYKVTVTFKFTANSVTVTIKFTVNDFGPNCDSELFTPKRHPEITKIDLPATLVDLERSLYILLCYVFFHAESNGGVHFTLSIEIKELEQTFRNPGSRDIARSAPPSGENLFFTKLCGLLYLFRITHNPPKR